MGYLNGPRINFWGGASSNVDTANNQSNPVGNNCIVDLVSAGVMTTDDDAELVEALRQATDSTNYPESGWNYYGDHQVAFMSATVSSSGQPGAMSTSGDLVKEGVYLLGSVDPENGAGPYGGPVMVDLDPTGGQSTQIYVGGLQIGYPQAKLHIQADTRCHSHFLGLRYDRKTTGPPFPTPGSVYANGTFQLGFPKEAVKSYDDSVQILKDIVEAPGAIGVVLRFAFFEFMPGMSPTELQEDYKNNYNSSNPSLGRVIGTIGPWFAGEPATCPPGRLLNNTKLGGAQGVAHLDTGADRLSLDLVSALQGQAIRQDSKANTGPIGPNVDYGDLQINTSAGQATAPSLPDTYYLYGGIYDVGLSAAQTTALTTEAIAIGSSQNDLAIAEAPIRVYSNDRNIYLDDAGGKATVELTVEQLGGAVQADVQLALATGTSGTIPDAEFLTYPAALTVPAGSAGVSFEVSDNGGDPGFTALNVDLGGAQAYFVNFRKYSPVDYGGMIAAGGISWETAYERCLRFYYLLFPAMTKRIPLDDQASIGNNAAEILKRISDAYRDTTLYMPVTRSLSPGKVALLRTYLQEQQAAGGGSA